MAQGSLALALYALLLAHATEPAHRRSHQAPCSRQAPSLLTQRRRATQPDESNALARSSAAFPAASRASSLSPYAARCFLCSSAYARRPSDSHATCRRTQACRRRMHSLLSRAAHLCARCWLFLAHVTPTRPPLLRQYVVPRSAHGRRFSQAAQKDTRRIKSSFPQSILFLYLFLPEVRECKGQFCVSSLLRKTTVPYKGACSTQRQRAYYRPQAAHGTQHATPRHRPLQKVRALENSNRGPTARCW